MNTQPKGFTRVEILVVAMILVILVGTVVVSLNPEDYKVITSNRELYLAGIGNERQLTIKGP